MNKPLSKARKLIYCSGITGFSILDNIFGACLVFFVLPPKESGLPELVSKKPVLLGFTILGLIIIFGRVIDSFADPIIAFLSDKAKFKIGRRKFFLLTGSLPFALFSFLMFKMPTSFASSQNIVYLAIILGLYFIFYTYYMAPYLALIPEIGTNNKERLFITSVQAYLILLGGGVILLGVPLGWEAFKNIGLNPSSAYTTVIGLASLSGFLFLFSGALSVKEKPIKNQPLDNIGIFDSLFLTIRNKSFIFYMTAVIMFWSTFHIIRATVAYYPIALLGQESQDFQTILMVILFASAAICFPISSLIAIKLSNKIAMLSGLLSISLISCITFFITSAGDNSELIAMIQMALYGFPVAILMVVPNTIIANIAEIDNNKNGMNREAMFFGTQGFFMKFINGIAIAIITYLFAIFGKDASNPLGVQLTGFAGAIFALIGFFVMLKYPQKEVTETLKEIHK